MTLAAAGWAMLTFALASLSACAVAHEAAPDLVDCQPRVSPTYLWHADTPWPRGRMHACESCVRTEEALLARAIELGCPLHGLADRCTLDGACDYGPLHDHWQRIRDTTDCAALARLAQQDPCVRPDERTHWRERRD